ncbi:dihydroxyacetone kinase subunit DhaK [Streptomyces sp. NPDC006733]|uniref:dihydroxyacetone kinase subunit DhaK n=1 Tax=Streptomyces sp. NPDC006733 TaxID=3155460 RepID=UPI0033EDA544
MVYFAHSMDRLVDDGLAGFARAHGDLVRWHPDDGFVQARHPAPTRRVALVSGGGSGHEPLHLGFVGAGMLDAACPGRLMASPHNRQIFQASCAVAQPGGVLHLVKNYTGDRINFGIAAERLAQQGIACARVLIDDDLASESPDTAVGRRGTAATVLIEKVLGAAADTGLGLRELTELGTELAARSRSLAVASAAHTSPATGRPAFTLPPDELEFGVGIHGERAKSSIARRPLDELVATMTEALVQALALRRGTGVIVLVNGLGAVTQLELYAVLHETAQLLDRLGLVLERSLVGSLVTALDMRGFSLTLMQADDAVVKFYDAPARTPAWPR